jgi:tetratricopeptide (TPR) repeat protein
VTAIAYYREAIRLCPEFADAHSNLGNALKEIGEMEDAIGIIYIIIYVIYIYIYHILIYIILDFKLYIFIYK